METTLAAPSRREPLHSPAAARRKELRALKIACSCSVGRDIAVPAMLCTEVRNSWVCSRGWSHAPRFTANCFHLLSMHNFIIFIVFSSYISSPFICLCISLTLFLDFTNLRQCSRSRFQVQATHTQLQICLKLELLPFQIDTKSMSLFSKMS